MRLGRGAARAQPGRGGGSPQAAGRTEARASGADAFEAAGGEEDMAGEQAGVEGGWGLGWAGGRLPEKKMAGTGPGGRETGPDRNRL